MPYHETLVTGEFVLADAYHAELFAAATNDYLAASNAVEQLRMNRLTDAEADAALQDALGALDVASGSLAAVAKSLVFDVVGDGVDTNVTAGAPTIYVGAKAFTLTNNSMGELVFDVQWGKFSIAYDPAPDKWSDVSTHGCSAETDYSSLILSVGMVFRF